MKLKDFLDVADDDDMVEVYADDGATRPCELKLVDSFQVSDYVGGILDVCDEVEAYENREVTGVATVKLDGCGDDTVVGIRVYVEQKEGDEDVRNQGVRKVDEVQDEGGVPEVPDGVDRGDGRGREGQGGGRTVEPGCRDQHDGHGQVKKVVGVRVHEHSVPELVIQEIPDGGGHPANVVVLPGIEAPDTEKLGGDDAIGYDLAERVVRACRAAEGLGNPSRSAVRGSLAFACARLRDVGTLVGSSATGTVSEESVEALIRAAVRAAVDCLQRAGKAMGFDLEEAE